MESSSVGANGSPNSTTESKKARVQKSYFDVLGMCCNSEVTLVENILHSVDGVQSVSVILPSKTVIVVHDSLMVSPPQIAKVLNEARLEASIQAYDIEKIINKWPNSYILVCGFLLIVSLLEPLYHPLQWLRLAAAVAGLPPVVLRSVAAVQKLSLDINVLMLIAVCGAIALGDYSEAGMTVFLFITAGWLEMRASERATSGISSIMKMAPQYAILAENGQAVDVRELNINTDIVVKAGDVIPVDGIVINGSSEVDERSLTGESFPVCKQPQSQVWAGTLNIDGYIVVRTTALAENSTVAKMVKLVEEAQNSRSKMQRLINKCANYYTPAVIIAAIGVAMVPLIVRFGNVKYWFQLALVILVSACPCALVLSTPVATFCALLTAAGSGVLVKGADVLESLAKTKFAAFDKTGTITRGEFRVEQFVPVKEISLDTLLYWVSSIESKSSHPMAASLIEYAKMNSVEPMPDNVRNFRIYPGQGIYGEINGRCVYIGNRSITAQASCEIGEEDALKLDGIMLGYVICDSSICGVFALWDSCRTGAKEAIEKLRSLDIKPIMLTGDSVAAATYAHDQLGHVLEEIHCELRPDDKVRIIRELDGRGSTLMIGDGMNDAAALAAATVGISMGVSGSAVAMETSDIILMSNDITRIPYVIKLARRTHQTICINFIASIMAKVAILVLAFLGHPLLWAAVLADVGTCLLVILNSMLLLRKETRQVKLDCCAGDGGVCGSKGDCKGLNNNEAGNAALREPLLVKETGCKKVSSCKRANKNPGSCCKDAASSVPGGRCCRAEDEQCTVTQATQPSTLEQINTVIKPCCQKDKSCTGDKQELQEIVIG